jgi:putative sterol carrier protein
MKAIETTATLTENGQLTLDEPLSLTHPNRVRVIVLIPEDDSEQEKLQEDSIETIREGLYQGWQDVLTGKTRPVSQLWEGMDVD